MKTIVCSLILSCMAFTVCSQNDSLYRYDATTENPYGLPNPDAPDQIKDFDPLIGKCNCRSVSRSAGQPWSDRIVMTWRFKYIMNGYAVQDETFKADDGYSGSIRVFNTDSAYWQVHYFDTGSTPDVLPVWTGSKTEDGSIILYRPSPRPDGMEGFYRITFFNISESGFDWIGEWVDEEETMRYPLWKIFCEKSN
ncbi:hypothetical protein N9355_07155 [Crocinitomicaceae bacterium]|nr:hypothetical protein [Crocinitomicaceae bacterium]